MFTGAKENAISERTLRRAYNELGGHSKKEGGQSFWCLPTVKRRTKEGVAALKAKAPNKCGGQLASRGHANVRRGEYTVSVEMS